MLTRILILIMVSLLTACGSGSNVPAQAAATAEQSLPQNDGPLSDNDPVQDNDPEPDYGALQNDTLVQVENPAQPELPAQPDTTIHKNITTTASGLQYEILRAAEGPKPGKASVVTVDYVGTLTDGTEFDSSYARGLPATFSLAQVIRGWTEGVQLMSVGSKYRFVIPANLAYGDSGRGETIKPGDTLVFDVELLEINS